MNIFETDLYRATLIFLNVDSIYYDIEIFDNEKVRLIIYRNIYGVFKTYLEDKSVNINQSINIKYNQENNSIIIPSELLIFEELINKIVFDYFLVNERMELKAYKETFNQIQENYNYVMSELKKQYLENNAIFELEDRVHIGEEEYKIIEREIIINNQNYDLVDNNGYGIRYTLISTDNEYSFSLMQEQLKLFVDQVFRFKTIKVIAPVKTIPLKLEIKNDGVNWNIINE